MFMLMWSFKPGKVMMTQSLKHLVFSKLKCSFQHRLFFGDVEFLVSKSSVVPQRPSRLRDR